MNNNKSLQVQDISYFYEITKDVKKMKQDTVFHHKPYKKHDEKRNICNQDAHIKFFNSNVPPKNIKKNPVSYVRDKCFKPELKKLKNNIYKADVFIDLHGLNQYQAQQELGNLISMYELEKIVCFGVIHGHGKNILKNYIPIWLSKHPDVIAFYQSPKIFGKNTTLFVVMDYKN